MATKVSGKKKIKARGDTIKANIDSSTTLAELRTECSKLVTLLLRVNRKVKNLKED